MRNAVALLCLLCVLLFACKGATKSEKKTDSAPEPAAAPAAQEAEGGYATGRVTLEDGKPLTGDIEDINISISGVSESGEKVSYTPIVKDGVYRQKLVPGQYRFDQGRIKVRFGQNVFTLNLAPVGPNWSKNRDAAEGIVQDFVWKPAGQAETYGATPDPNNATHWYGLSVGMRFTTYRSDLNKPAEAPPDGTKLIFTLTPTSKSIDGRDLQPIVVERDFHPTAITTNDDLNDLPIANYDLTGIARLPDGTTRPLVFQGKGHYPNYVSKAGVTVEYDNIIGGLWKQLMGWGLG